MLNFLFIIFMHLLPLILFLIPFLLLFDISLKSSKKKTALPPTPALNELEERLNLLITKNKINNQTQNLSQNLEQTSTNTISQYISLDKKKLNGFHLFQLIFNYIKNQAEDEKIIKILRHYLPTSSTSHLYAILHSYKVFLNIIQKDPTSKKLLTDLFQNDVKSTLIYLEEKLHLKLSELTKTPAAMQPLIINQAVIYAMIFATFSEFYDKTITLKILKLAKELSPNLFKYWHTYTKNNKKHLPNDHKYCINYYTSKKIKKTLDYKMKYSNNTPQSMRS